MKTELNTQDRIMFIMVLAGLILVALAFLMPNKAEAGVVVRAQIGSVGVAVATDSPRGVIVQTGPRSYRCDMGPRPLRPLRGHYFWVPGHYEKILEIRKGRPHHKHGKFNRGRRAHGHNRYREVWVPGHWERI